MKKLNNKGMTLVELVVTFAIVMILVIGMLSVIISLKNDMNESSLNKELLEYKDTITYVINNDLIKLKANNIEQCTFNVTGDKGYCYKISFENNSTKNLEINLTKKYIKYDEIKYEIPESSIMEFRDSLIYASDNISEKIAINKDENDFINIYIPFFIIDEEENYGIDIVHPINIEFDLGYDTEFLYTGDYQEYKVPVDGYYYIEANGAQGGSTDKSIGGLGGYTSGYIYLKQGEKLYVYVGENLNSYSENYSFNGGGKGSYETDNRGSSSNGGGATDIRYFGDYEPTTKDLEWNSEIGLNSRIMVAGGGGGATNTDGGSYKVVGGSAGGLIGKSGNYVQLNTSPIIVATGGNQTSGGTGAGASAVTANPFVGSFGIGGSSDVVSNSWIYFSGGGGGYYGGGTGGAASSVVGSGAGGSSFISGYAGVNAINSSSNRTHTNNTLHYSSKYFIDGNMVSGYNSGNGRAIISYVGKALKRTNDKLNNVRYIKDCINGCSGNSSNHWVEVQAIANGKNVALNKNVTGTGTLHTDWGSGTYSTIVDGKLDNYSDFSSGLQCITIDLEKTYNLDEIAVWHYYKDGRSYNEHSLYVSSDNSTWTTLINNESGVTETPEGKRVSAYGDSYTLTNLIPNSSMENTGWTCPYSSEISRYGNYSCKLTGTTSTIEQYATLSSSITLNNTHKYYGRVEIFATAVNGESVDIFWPISGEGYFGSVGIYTPNKWEVYSLIVDRTNITNGSHGLRLDYNNNYSTNTAYYDGAMLIDLTEAFGVGNEPSKEWCDKYIRYFDGTMKISASILE